MVIISYRGVMSVVISLPVVTGFRLKGTRTNTCSDFRNSMGTLSRVMFIQGSGYNSNLIPKMLADPPDKSRLDLRCKLKYLNN